MTTRKRQLSLSVFVQLYGTHGHAWRRPGVHAGGPPQLAHWANIVKTLERGKFDFAFFADFVGQAGAELDGAVGRARGGAFEPTALVAALSTLTQNIGLVATVNTNFNEPYNLARRIASLDHLSGGRAGWNIVSSLAEGAARSFGAAELDPKQRYERAGEFVEVVKQLWDSWDDDAFDYPNPKTGQFVDPSSAHPVRHEGNYFKINTLLDVARPIQGYPVFFQAGNSEEGREFAARYGEVIYAAAQTLEEAKAFYSDVKGRLSKYGREPEDLVVTPGLFYHIGRSRAEAQEKYESFREAIDIPKGRRVLFGVDVSDYPLDGPLPQGLPQPLNGRGRWAQLVNLAHRENLSIRELFLRFQAVQGHRIVVGTPADIADQIEDWFVNEGADGFNLKPSLIPDSLDDFVNLVVPELQRRGIFRKEYKFSTLRENLGLKRPANPYTRALRRQYAS
jgi:FMN-dependent oxidoreductase (nitrilotriacetate monooxygenase family)